MKKINYAHKADIYKNHNTDDYTNDINGDFDTDEDFYEDFAFGSMSDEAIYDFLEEQLKAVKKKRAKRAAIIVSTIAAIIGTLIFLVSHFRKKGG